MSEDLLKVCHVNKTFPIKGGMFSKSNGVVHAVDDVSFTIHKGETFGLVGESGCGKSTLSRTILQLIPADSGEVIFEGKDLRKLSKNDLRKERRYMRMIFQKPFDSLNPRQTVRDIIGTPIRIHEKCSAEEREKQILQLMERVGLPSAYIDRYPHEFSGGQRQRIGIARALAMRPKLIVCDEPVSALDVSIQAQILNLLKALQREDKLTYLFISHNLSVVNHMSDRIAVMYLGSIMETAEATELYHNPLHPYTQALLSAIPDPSVPDKPNRIILQGDIPSPVNVPQGCRFCTRCWKATERCSKERPPFYHLKDGHAVACFLYEKEGDVQ